MAQENFYQERLKKVVNAMGRYDIDSLLLNRTCNIAYLTGTINSCSWVFLTKEGRQVALVLDSDKRLNFSLVLHILFERDHSYLRVSTIFQKTR